MTDDDDKQSNDPDPNNIENPYGLDGDEWMRFYDSATGDDDEEIRAYIDANTPPADPAVLALMPRITALMRYIHGDNGLEDDGQDDQDDQDDSQDQ